jgi:alanine dehydrogenase
MDIGLIKEIKNGEGRVALTPQGIKEILGTSPSKHRIFVEHNAGEYSGFSDAEYKSAGATILSTAKEVCAQAKMIVHVKEPLEPELPYLRKDHILFTYLHLAPEPELTHKLMEIGCTCFAYETLEGSDHSLPLLAPMSAVAGKMAFVYALYAQQRKAGGQGIYLGQIDGKLSGNILIIGGGVVGQHAAEPFIGIGANVVIIEKVPQRREMLQKKFPAAKILPDTALIDELAKADVIVGAVLIPGAKAPKLIRKQDFHLIKKKAVIVDISIDQGGITDVSHATSIQDPTYTVDDVVMVCIPNIPGTVPRTSTQLLTIATLPYIKRLADKGLAIIKDDPAFQTALNLRDGKCTNRAVAEGTGVPYTPFDKVL